MCLQSSLPSKAQSQMGPLHATAIQTTMTVLHRSSNTLFWERCRSPKAVQRVACMRVCWQFNIVIALLDDLMSSSPVELKRNEKI